MVRGRVSGARPVRRRGGPWEGCQWRQSGLTNGVIGGQGSANWWQLRGCCGRRRGWKKLPCKWPREGSIGPLPCHDISGRKPKRLVMIGCPKRGWRHLIHCRGGKEGTKPWGRRFCAHRRQPKHGESRLWEQVGTRSLRCEWSGRE